MVTYADMVTLLLCFFVMLLAMATWDETIKIQLVLDSIRWALGSGGMMESQTGLNRPAGQGTSARQTVNQDAGRAQLSKLGCSNIVSHPNNQVRRVRSKGNQLFQREGTIRVARGCVFGAFTCQ